jgi:hypothetical protein
MKALHMGWRAGRMDVDAMLAELSRPQVIEWLAYLELEPATDRDKDDRMAELIAYASQSGKPPSYWQRKPPAWCMPGRPIILRLNSADVLAMFG